MGEQGRKVRASSSVFQGIMLKNGSGDLPFGLSVSGNNIHQLSFHSALLKGLKIKVTALNMSSGQQVSQQTLSSENEVTNKESILFVGSGSATPLLIWTDSSLKVIKVNVIGTKHVASINVVNSNKEAIKQIKVHAPQATGSPPHFLVHYQSLSSHWAEVYHVDAVSGAVTRAYDLPKLGGLGGFSSSTENEKIYFTRHTEFETILLSSSSESVIRSWAVRPKSHGGLADPQDIIHAASEVVAKGASSFAVRSALTLQSGDWELIRNGDPLWLRSESIAGIVAASWVELNQAESLAQELAAESHSGPLGAYFYRFRRHTRDFVTYFPGFVENLPKRIMGIFTGSKGDEQRQSPDKDTFGFKKMIIVATEQGRLALLDTGNQGQMKWNVKAVDLGPGEKWQVLGIIVRSGVATVYGSGGESFAVEVVNGNILHHQPGSSSSSLKTFLPVLDAMGNEVEITINKDGSIENKHRRPFESGTTLTTQGMDNIARGWSLGQDGKPRLTWEFVPTPGEQIISLTSRPALDPVASIGKALGDRNVMYKYLNPNLMLITTLETAAFKAAVYLLDSTSGEILHTARHHGVNTVRPIVATMTENWFAYSIFIDPGATETGPAIGATPLPKGHQLVVSELFEASFPNDRGPLGSSFNFSNVHSTTSEIDATISPPHVISQAYLLPGPISYLTTTSTLQSITPRSLLCILPAMNGIISIPRNIIDPRRPVGRDPTPAELEEGLFRHNHMLDFEPKWMITHQREVRGLKKVITSPSLLESTSLIFAYGELDVFGTRVAPIGGFDMLGKGFSRFQLMATVVGLAIGTGALAPMVSLSPLIHPRGLLASCRRGISGEMDDIANVVAGPEKADRRDLESLMSGYCIANHRHIKPFMPANTPTLG